MYQPKFTISHKILKHIGIIEAAKQVIDHAPLLPYYEKKFQNEAVVRSVHHGTHLEGNELNLTQAERVLLGQDIVARERDVQEVINYRKVIDFIGEETLLEAGGKRRAINADLIKKMHALTVEKILDAKRAGEYRQTQVVIKNSLTGEVTFRPPMAILVQRQIQDLLDFINQSNSEEIHPVLKGGIVHYEFVRIHPFVDGNGRLGRALSTLVLFQEGYDIRKFFSLEEYFDSDAARYYAALQSVTEQSGDLTAWLEYFTEGLAIELAKTKDKVEHISIDARLKEKLGGSPLMLTDRQLQIIEYIQKIGYLQNSGFKQLFPFVSEDTVLNDLKALLNAGLLKKQGKTKAARYLMG